MHQRKSYQSITACMLISLFLPSLIIFPGFAFEDPVVGVKKGDWIEFEVIIEGKGSMPPTHDVTWMRMTVMEVEGPTFLMNVTSRYSNGTIGTAIWPYNFSKGEHEGWTVIPANLSPGDTFYDLARHTEQPVNVTILREEEKMVLGAMRTITYGQDIVRDVKIWDKETGFFLGSVEPIKNKTTKSGHYIEDLVVTTNAIATNIWQPQEIESDDSGFYWLFAVVLAATALVSLAAIIIARKKKIPENSLSSDSQAKIAILSIIGIILIEIGTILFFPFNSIGISFAQFNLIMQTIWTAVVLVSMWFRKEGNYFVHEITLLIVMCAWIIGFSAVIFMDPLSLASLEAFSNTTLRLIMNILHGVFSVPAIVFGIWLVALWRPNATSFPGKTKKLAILTTAFWIPSYIVGVLDFMVLHTTFFG